MSVKFKPLYDRILVQRTEVQKKTKGGLYIPESAKEKPIEGKIIAVGNGKITDSGDVRELAVKKGDRVLFGKYSGTEIKLDGEDYLIMREDEILGIVE